MAVTVPCKPNVAADLQAHGRDLSFTVADRCFIGMEQFLRELEEVPVFTSSRFN